MVPKELVADAKPGYRKQVSLLLDVPPEVGRADRFALHGETAINPFVRDMPRLSLDIDLAYVPVENWDTSMVLGGSSTGRHTLANSTIQNICMRVSASFHGIIKMSQELDHKLDCPNCKTIYLTIPKDVSGHTPINCTSCGVYLGSWGELQADFFKQGGMNGAFRLDKGQFARIDQDTMHVHELASGGPEQLRVALIESEQQKEVAPDA